MEETSKAYYEKVRQAEIAWIKNFIEQLPRIGKSEKDEILALVDGIEIDTIGKLDLIVQNSDNISDKDKDIFFQHLQQIEWFDWKPGEKYRSYNGHMYVRMTPAQWLSDELIEEYYKEQPPEERAKYEVQKYIEQHPRKAKNMTQYDRLLLYEKNLSKFKREWKKKNLDSASDETDQESEKYEADVLSPKIKLYEEAKKDNIYQLAFTFDPPTKEGEEKQLRIYQEKVNGEKPGTNGDLLDTDLSMVTNEETLPVLNFNRQYMNNTKLSRILTTKQIDITEDKFNLNINERVVNLVDIWSDQNITLSNTNITQYDLSVMDAAYTIMSQGPMLITPEWILRVMSGNPKQKLTEKKINEVKASIKKLQGVRIKVDCTEEYNAYQLQKGKSPVDSWTYESYLLPLGKIEARYEANGKVVTAYTVLEKPALYRYAEMNHQIVDVPAYLLETQDHFSDTDEAVLIKRYVIRRVAQIVKKNSIKSNKISFLWYDKTEDAERGLFPELGYKPDNTHGWRKKKAKINDIVKGTLQTLVDGNAISKYEEYREDGTNNPASPIIGYKIYYEPKMTVLPVK